MDVMKFAESVDALRIFPRLMLGWFCWLVTVVFFWYMGLINPTSQQAALLTVVSTTIPAVFAFYASTGKKWGKNNDV